MRGSFFGALLDSTHIIIHSSEIRDLRLTKHFFLFGNINRYFFYIFLNRIILDLQMLFHEQNETNLQTQVGDE